MRVFRLCGRRCKRVWWRSTSFCDVDCCLCRMHRTAMLGAVAAVTIFESVRKNSSKHGRAVIVASDSRCCSHFNSR